MGSPQLDDQTSLTPQTGRSNASDPEELKEQLQALQQAVLTPKANASMPEDSKQTQGCRSVRVMEDIDLEAFPHQAGPGRCGLSGTGIGSQTRSSPALGSGAKPAIGKRNEQLREPVYGEVRSQWPCRLAPKGRSEWNPRHPLMFENRSTHRNFRSYYDRWIPARPPGEEPLVKVPLKTTWSLLADGESAGQREASRRAAMAMSPAGFMPDVQPSKSAASAPGRRKVRGKTTPSRPWEELPACLRDGQSARTPLPGGGGSGHSQSVVSDEKVEASVVQKWFEAPPPGVHVPQEVGDWDSHHHVIWCNEQRVGEYSKLNPKQARSYFDRLRVPDVGSRSKTMRKPREDCPGEEVVRMLPSWRLEPLPGQTLFPDVDDALKVTSTVLESHSGSGGWPKSSSSYGDSTLACSTGRAPEPTPESMLDRERAWNHRHDIVFGNTEVSKLDRCYFDRFREAECLLPVDASQRKTRDSVRVWSLEPGDSPEEEAKQVTSAGNRRFARDGRWNDAHHKLFDNRIHQNARSYFERMRDPLPDSPPVHLLLMTDTSELPEPRYQDPTAARERKEREKLRDEERLLVKWSLQELSSPKDRNALVDSLRRSDSELAVSKAKRRRKKRRDDWFSAHGVVF